MTTPGHIKPNQRRSKLSGWQLTTRMKRSPAVMPEEPTRWHRMLYSIGVEEESVKKATGEARAKIIAWARKNVDHCYVPSWLIEELQLTSRYES